MPKLGPVAGEADRRAAEALPPLRPQPRTLVYAARTAEFVELSRDGLRLLGALRRAGTVGALLTQLEGRASDAALARARAFFGRLLALGVLESARDAERLEAERTALLAANG